MPLRVEVCVPAALVTDTVAFLLPVVWVVSGRNCTVTTQAAPGAKVVWPRSCPPPAGPQVDINRMMKNSVGSVPPSAPCAMLVSVTFPVLVSVNTWTGPVKLPLVTPFFELTSGSGIYAAVRDFKHLTLSVALEPTLSQNPFYLGRWSSA